VQAISHKLAEMATKIEAARLLTYRAAWYYDHGTIDPALTSMAKAYAARAAVEVTDYAIQILGGYGYFAEYRVERFHRDAKITDIYEGTTEINKTSSSASCRGRRSSESSCYHNRAEAFQVHQLRHRS